DAPSVGYHDRMERGGRRGRVTKLRQFHHLRAGALRVEIHGPAVCRTAQALDLLIERGELFLLARDEGRQIEPRRNAHPRNELSVGKLLGEWRRELVP